MNKQALTKTARIVRYELFQAKGYAARVVYRGRMVHEAVDADKVAAMRAAEKYCKSNGFTHARVCEESARLSTSNYTIKL